MEWEQVKGIVKEIKEKTAMPAYSLVLNPQKKPDIFSSKFGGVPYWDLSRDYPCDKKGNPLMLLAQINLDKADVEAPLPQQGMLQFFTALDDVYGADFDAPDSQDTFRVIYHETVDYKVTQQDIMALHPPVSTDEEYGDYTPVFHEAVVDIVKKTAYMGDATYLFEEIFHDIAKEKFGEDIGNQTPYSVMEDDTYDKMVEELSTTGHWLLGYPYFTQYDPRETAEEYRVYDTLLFQMDSDFVKEEDYVLWGDCGVANFFINHEDLEKKDFSKVLYNWDCC